MNQENIVAWIQSKIKDTGAKGVIVGLSGGVDSSCVAVLCKKAFPNNTLGIIMPCFSNQKDLEHAQLVTQKFDIPHEIIELTEPFEKLYSKIEKKEYNETENNLAISNLKPRLRMCALYYYANKLNYLVVGTDNKSESMIGYFTKYGDGGVDILPIADLFKKDVKELAKQLNIPEIIINKEPSAGLWTGQTDIEEIGMKL